MPGALRFFKKKFHTTGSGEVVSLTAKDPYWNMVGLLLRSRVGAVSGSQNNTVVDSSSNNFPVTRNGNVTQGSFSPYATGGGSMYFDGTGDYLTATNSSAFDLSDSSDFTIEAWIYRKAVNGWFGIISERRAATAEGWALYVHTNNTLYMGSTIVGTSFLDRQIHTALIPTDVWTHIALVKTSSGYTAYVNGVPGALLALTGGLQYVSAAPLAVGSVASTAEYLCTGYIADPRIVKGAALYTSKFSLPTAPLTAVAGTQLLLSGNNASIVDYSKTSIIETVGNAQVSSVKKFTEGAMYFDGNVDYLQLQALPEYSFGTGDFTVEAWIYPVSITSSMAVLQLGDTGSANLFQFGFNALTGFGVANNATWFAQSTVVPKANEWTHVAACRQNGVLRIFINGIMQASATCTNSFASTAQNKVGTYSTYYFNGYIDDLRVTKGVGRYISSFAVDTQYTTDPYAKQSISLLCNAVGSGDLVDPSFSSVNLLTHFEGNITDVKGRTLTNSGVTFPTTQPLFGTTSAYFNGTQSNRIYGSYPSLSGDFTVEMWIHPTAYNPNGCRLIDFANNQYSHMINMSATGTLNYYQYGNSGTNGVSTAIAPLNTWSHVAFVRSGSTGTLYLNGVSILTSNINTGVWGSGSNITIGNMVVDGWGVVFTGYMKDVRISNIARYTATFTSPVAAFPEVQGTGITKGVIVDSSSNNLTLTKNGNVLQGTFSPFSNSGFSTYFDGTGDYIQVGPYASWHYWNICGFHNLNGGLGSTLEAWVYVTQGGKRNTIFGSDWALFVNASNMLSVDFWNGSGVSTYTSTTAFPLNTWVHVAIVGSPTGSNILVFQNGSKVVDAVGIPDIYMNGHRGTIGAGYDGSSCFTGYISSLKFVAGVRKYTSNFTVSTLPLTDETNCKVLALTRNRFIDTSSLNTEVIVNGNPAISAFSPFSTTSYSPEVNGGSLYFDGNSDYVSLPTAISQSQFALHSGDFTLECWVYPIVATDIALFAYGSLSNSSWAEIGYAMDIQSQKLTFVNGSGGNGNVAQSSLLVKQNVWTHVAVSRLSGVVTLFVNGVKDGASSFTFTTHNDPADTLFRIGKDFAVANWTNGYIADARLIKGTALYTANFTPPTAPLTAVTNTQLLLSGTNAAVYDRSGKASIELAGTTRVSTSVKKYSSSMAFDGTVGCYAKFAGDPSQFTFGTGDFTVEGWFRRSVLGTQHQIIDFGSTDGAYPAINIGAGNVITYYTASANRIIGTTNVGINTWYHFALSRYNGVTNLYLNGVKEGSSYTDTNNYSVSVDKPVIGTFGANSTLFTFNGYIEDLRITKGVARYTSNFTVPANTLNTVIKGLPATMGSYSATALETTGGDLYYNNVVLHMHMNGTNGSTTFADQKGNTVTASGNTVIKSEKAKFGASSAYFDGTGDYLAVTSNAAFAFGTGDFTLEGWIYPTAFNAATWLGIFSVGQWGPGTTSAVVAINNTYITCMVGGTTNTASTPHNLVLNNWYHVSLTRLAGIATLYINGAVISTWSAAGNISDTAPFIGGNMGTSVTGQFYGYIDEVRFTKGVTRYPVAFTPSAVAFADYQAFAYDPYLPSSVVIKGTANGNNNTLLDSSVNNLTVTRNGNVTQGTFSPFSNTGWSAYFGNSQVDVVASVGSGYTVSGWLYLNDTTPFQMVYKQRGNLNDRAFMVVVSGGKLHAGRLYAIAGSSMDIPKNQWFHFAATTNHYSNTVWVNGVQGVTVNTSGMDGTSSLAIGGDGSIYLKGYLHGLCIKSGMISGNFTPPSSKVVADANTLLLTMQDNRIFNSGTLSATFTPYTVTQQPVSPFKTSEIVASSNGSMYFDGTGDYLSTSSTGVCDFGTGDFTVACWVNTAVIDTSIDVLITNNGGGAGGCALQINRGVTGGIQWWKGQGLVLSSATALTVNSWNHIAVARASGTSKMFLNGVQVATVADGNDYTIGNANIYFGNDPTGSYYLNGYMSDTHIVKGTALYTSAFTPATVPSSLHANTQVLLRGSNAAIIDATGKVNVETYGASSSLINKRYSSSFSFNGTSDYLTINGGTACTFNTGDFTIEAWVNRATIGVAQCLFGFRPTATNSVISPDLQITSSNFLMLYVSGAVKITGTIAIPANTWTHIALSRVNGISYLFVNGAMCGSSADTNAYTITANRPCIGVDGYGVTTGLFKGMIEDARITNGVGRYVAGFTPPLRSLPTV